MASLTTFQKEYSHKDSLNETRVSSELGDSSGFICEICAEKTDNDEIFPFGKNNSICSTHKFCKTCISRHITTKLVANREKSPVITCPGSGCGGVLEIGTCGEILPKHVVVLWDEVICESLIPPAQRFYCPYKDCSGLLMNDGGGDVREAECPFCNRLFCARCRVTWHSGVDCEEFSKLSLDERGREDLMVHELAKKNQWQRCPRCNFFVEKNEGCLHMTCRCEFQFCYACGAAWSSTHGGCR